MSVVRVKNILKTFSLVKEKTMQEPVIYGHMSVITYIKL
jgi:hypothetical protein